MAKNNLHVVVNRNITVSELENLTDHILKVVGLNYGYFSDFQGDDYEVRTNFTLTLCGRSRLSKPAADVLKFFVCGWLKGAGFNIDYTEWKEA